PTVALASGKAQSRVFTEGGFKWIVEMHRSIRDYEKATFVLRCSVDDSIDSHMHWQCKGDVKLCVNDVTWDKDRFTVDNASSWWLHESHLSWEAFTRTYVADSFIIDGKACLEFRINITDSSKIPAAAARFAVPNERSNVILKFGEQRLHIFKDLFLFIYFF
ncbi:hypothetical protein PMAYCL1PPCAC_08346, partial [Pristionchus mayeri]